jgi:integrase
MKILEDFHETRHGATLVWSSFSLLRPIPRFAVAPCRPASGGDYPASQELLLAHGAPCRTRTCDPQLRRQRIRTVSDGHEPNLCLKTDDLSRCDVACRCMTWYPLGIPRVAGYQVIRSRIMPTKRITAAILERMQPGEVAWDSEVRGFGVRYRARDQTYLVKTRIKGKQRILTIGRHGRGAWGPETARREAQRLLGLIRDGKDPSAERDARKIAPTLASFVQRFTDEYASAQHKPRTRQEVAGLFRRCILPALGEMKLRDIGRAEVARMHASMRATPVAANRALALLSVVLGWAERVGERDDGSNPCRHVDRFPEKARERFLSALELARLGDALEHAGQSWTEESKAEWARECERQAEAAGIPHAQRTPWIVARSPRRNSAEDWRALAAIRLLLFTGARLSEILTMRRDWIDMAHGVARLPDSKTGRKDLFLPPGALAVLEGLPRFAENPFVLPGDRPGAHFIGIQKPWQRLRALAGLPGLRIHDLRHGFASVAVAAGDSLFIVGKLLGHRQSRTTERYAHLAPDPAKAVADRTGERLADLLGRKAGGAATNSVYPLVARKH